MFDFENSNKEQIEAIKYIDGPLLIIAGPGTGKTYTLIKRTIYLISEKNVSPENIMIITFTDKAAQELITRLSNELLKINIDININEMYIGTFHSICLKLIKENVSFTNLRKNYRLLDDFEQQFFIYSNFRNFAKLEGFNDVISNNKSYWNKSEDLCKYINIVSEELVNLDEMKSSSNIKVRFVANLITEYNKLRLEENFIDFTNIQVEAYYMLLNNPNLLDTIRTKIKYLMVDEYQDTNYIQEQLCFLISNKNNICVVGDDDQSLYRFRGASVRNILEFPQKFSNCKTIKLIKNYRSEKQIVDFYNMWMNSTSSELFEFDWNNFRFDKRIISAKQEQVDSNTVIKLEAHGNENIYDKIVGFIKNMLLSKKIKDLNQIAFLFKSVKNSKVIELAEYLENEGFNVYSPRSDMFFTRAEIKELIGCILLTFPQFFDLIIKKDETGEYSNKISKYYADCLYAAQTIIFNKDNVELKNFIKLTAKNHVYIDKSLDYSFSGLIYRFLQFTPFNNYVNSKNDSIINTRESRNIAIYLNATIRFEYLSGISVFTVKNILKIVKKYFNQYLKFLYDGGISEYEDSFDYAPSGCISFMTIHQAKGLEFPIVFLGNLGSPRKQLDPILIDIEDSFYKRPPFETREDIKYYDFWRLYYTAFSRAQNLLVLVADKSDSAIRKEPSIYFENVYNDLNTNININSFKFNEIKQGNIKKSFSFTGDINVYEHCPLQYKFFKELGFQPVGVGSTIFGTLVHQTIEDIHKLVLNGEKNKISNDIIKEFISSNYSSISKKENKYLSQAFIESACKQVLNYVENKKNKWENIKEAEIPISLVRDNYILRGQIDLIEVQNGDYEIIDFKTEKKPEVNFETEKLIKNKRQLEVYAYLLGKKYNIKVSKISLYYTSELSGNPMISFNVNDVDLDNNIKSFDDIVAKIENHCFNVRTNDKKICKNCDLRFYCKRNEVV